MVDICKEWPLFEFYQATPVYFFQVLYANQNCLENLFQR